MCSECLFLGLASRQLKTVIVKTFSELEIIVPPFLSHLQQTKVKADKVLDYHMNNGGNLTSQNFNV